MTMEREQLYAGFAQPMNPKNYGKYEDTVTQLDFISHKKDKKTSLNPFDFHSAVCLKT